MRSFEIVAAETELPLLDGNRLRVWAYNGQVPGPTLRVRLGDTVRVHFVNHLPQPTTIHWHGVRVPNAMDGVPNLTQPPVEPGQSFDYEFTPKDAGTFWFHPHVRSSEQVERGLYGVLIVEDAAARRPTPRIWSGCSTTGCSTSTARSSPSSTRATTWRTTAAGAASSPSTGARRRGSRCAPASACACACVDTANGRVFKPDFGALSVQIIAVDGLYLRQPIPYTRLRARARQPAGPGHHRARRPAAARSRSSIASIHRCRTTWPRSSSTISRRRRRRSHRRRTPTSRSGARGSRSRSPSSSA